MRLQAGLLGSVIPWSRAVAVGMGIDLFEYETRVEDDGFGRLVPEGPLSSLRPQDSRSSPPGPEFQADYPGNPRIAVMYHRIMASPHT